MRLPDSRGQLCLAALALYTLAALNAAAAAEPPQRPRIGLVLAGGGAKGGAHVGVLKVLEKLHVPIDCIAGTSMGALVGGGYASGQSATEIEKFITGIDWEKIVGGAGRRALEPVEQKRLATESNSSLELGYRDGAVVTPSGLANSSAIDDLLRAYVARSRLVESFDKLPIPYRAVATDMITGDMVVLDHGDLANAMRASMAIPGAFSPVVGEGYILSDGGMVRNIPVDVARETCADIVIVVNLVEPPPTAEKLAQATQLLSRSMDVMFEVNEKIQLKSLTERDIRIDVPMGDISTADFDRVPDTIPLGEAAAQKVADRLSALAVGDAEYTAWRQKVNTSQEVETKVADVRIEGVDHVNPDYLKTIATIHPGDTVDINAISEDAGRMSALRDLESVGYRLEGDPNAATLVWLPQEVSIGTNVLRPSMGLYGDGGGDLKFLLGIQHVRSWLNDRGGQWRNNLQLGYESLLSTSLYLPFDVPQHFFVEPGLFGSRSVEDIYNDGENIATYHFVDYGGRVDFGWNMSRYAQIRVGYAAAEREVSVQTGTSLLPEDKFLDAGLRISARYDSRDAPSFARSGIAAAVDYRMMDDSLGSDRNWERLEAGFRTALTLGKNVMWLSLAGGTDLGEALPPDRTFSLGGPRTLPAYAYDELRVRQYWLAQASFLWKLKELVPVKNQAIYGGFGLQVAGFHDRVDLVSDDEIYGASAYVAGPTKFGTFALGAGVAPDSWSIWLQISRPVGKGSILDDGLFR
jgi:NTE family protein